MNLSRLLVGNMESSEKENADKGDEGLSKFLPFLLLTWLFGNPLIALVVLIILLYLADRRFVGITPSITKPLVRIRRLSRLKNQLALSPHDNSIKLNIARIQIERKQYRQAAETLESLLPVFTDSADVTYALGLCYLQLGRLPEGEDLIRQALELNPRVGYGEPYLRLGEAFAASDPDKAIEYLEQFKETNTSSCEAYYHLGNLYLKLQRETEAKQAFAEAIDTYRTLPRYKKRSERKWAMLARLRKK